MSKTKSAEGIQVESGQSFSQAFDRAERHDTAKKVGPTQSKVSMDVGAHTKAVSLLRYKFPKGEDHVLLTGQAVPVWDMAPGRKIHHRNVEIRINTAALVVDNDSRIIAAPNGSGTRIDYKEAVYAADPEAPELRECLGNVGGLWSWRPDMYPVGGVTYRDTPGGHKSNERADMTIGNAAPQVERFMPQLNQLEFVWLVRDKNGECEFFSVLHEKMQRYREVALPLALRIDGLPDNYLFLARQRLAELAGTSDVYLAVRSVGVGEEEIEDHASSVIEQ